MRSRFVSGLLQMALLLLSACGAGFPDAPTAETAIALPPDADTTALTAFTEQHRWTCADCARLTDVGLRNECQTCCAAGAGLCQGGTCCTPRNACNPGECGLVADGCGGTLDCGNPCTGFNTCGGGGVPNLCGCTALTAAQICTAGRCGQFPNGCGGTVDCGNSCTGTGQTCGGGGVPNQCGCTPTTCAAQGASCGPVANGC